jgi:hypothetical protein
MEASVGVGINEILDAGASITYYFEFAGPDNVVLPVFVHSILNASYTGPSDLGGSATAQITLLNDPSKFLFLQCTNLSCPSQQLDDTFSFGILSNTIYALRESVGIHGDEEIGDGSTFPTLPGPMNIFANADPFIYVDPSFANIGDFQLLLSDGITNGLGTAPETPTAAPEPGTFGLAGVAFAAIVAVRNRKLKTYRP